MPLDLTPFPDVPEQRDALSSAGVRQYITSPSWANFQALETLVESLESTVAAIPNTTSSSSMPDSATALDRWVDESENNQEKICNTTYTSGNGQASYWTSMRDVQTLALAVAAASSAVPTNTRGADFPSEYTQDWIFVNSSTGAIYICKETYDNSLPVGSRPDKFLSVTDAAATTAIANINTQISNFADDDIISASEKRALQREWTQIQNNKNLSITFATNLGKTSAASYVAMIAAFDALDLYLNTTITIFSDLDSDTSLTGVGSSRGEWNTKWTNWYSTQSTFSNFIGEELDDDIDSNQSDETITEAEKREAQTRWNYETKNYDQHEATVDALDSAGVIVKATEVKWIDYNNAYSALNTYLNTTLDLFAHSSWPLLLSDKGSSGAEWVTKWQTYTDAERALSQLTNTSFASQIDALADDNIITAGGEKILANQAWGAIYGTDGSDGEYALLISRANTFIAAGNTTLSTARDALVSAYSALNTYLLTTLSNFTDTTVNTTVVNSTWDGHWNLYYIQYANLDKATSDIADTDIGLISGLVNDEVITAGWEKQELIERFDQVTIEKTALVSKAALGAGADSTAYVAAYDALQAYLYGLFTGGDAPAFNNKDLGATSVNRSVWKQKWDDYYTEREALESAILSSALTNLTRDSAAIPTMAIDGEITVEEKAVAKVYWDIIYGTADNGEHSALSTQATGLGVASGTIDDFDDAFTVLWNFLDDNTHGAPTSASSPAYLELFDDMNNPTSLSASQETYWQQYWGEYYTNRDAIIIAIQAELQSDLDAKVNKDGSTTMTGSLNMGSNGITNLAAGAGSGQAVRYDEMVTGHTAKSDEIHGLSGAGNDVVGESETQTLTNKTIDGGNNTLQNIPTSAVPNLGTVATLDTGQNQNNIPKWDANGSGTYSRWSFRNTSGNLEDITGANRILLTDANGAPDTDEKNDAFNRDFGTGNTDVARGDHGHDGNTENGIATASSTTTVTVSLNSSKIAESDGEAIAYNIQASGTEGTKAWMLQGTLKFAAGANAGRLIIHCICTNTTSADAGAANNTSLTRTQSSFSNAASVTVLSNQYDLEYKRVDDDNVQLQLTRSGSSGDLQLSAEVDRII